MLIESARTRRIFPASSAISIVPAGPSIRVTIPTGVPSTAETACIPAAIGIPLWDVGTLGARNPRPYSSAGVVSSAVNSPVSGTTSSVVGAARRRPSASNSVGIPDPREERNTRPSSARS